MFGGFAASVLGMMTQSKSLDTIGMNIANINTASYKKHDTQFQTILSRTSSGNVSDMGGVSPITRPNIDLQGEVMTSQRSLDVAIFGKGFFILNSEIDGSGDTYYTRDGSFETVPGADLLVPSDDGLSQITVQEEFLTDKNGYYVMGWPAERGGHGFDTSGAFGAMRIDPYLFHNSGIATSEATYIANVPNQAATGENFVYNMEVFDSNGGVRNLALNFTKDAAPNEWTLTTDYKMAPTAQVTSISLSGSIESGDTFSVDVDGQTVTYNVTGTEPNMNAVRSALINSLNTHPVISQDVTASAGAAGEIILTAKVANNSFLVTPSTAQGLSSVSQTDTVTLTGPVGNLDSYTMTIGADVFTYNAGGPTPINAVRDNLVAQISLNPKYSATATAPGKFTVTANTVGGSFTLVATAFNGDGVPGNAATTTTTTPSYIALTDNAISAPVNTTDSSEGMVSTAPVALTFDGKGQILTPTTLPISITWTDSSTTALELDLSEMTQYHGEFTTLRYSQDGYAAGGLRDIQFSEQGHLLGEFTSAFTRPLYQLSMGVFLNPNELEQHSGNIYRETEAAGTVLVTTAGQNKFATISANSLELSNVDVAEEFSKMIVAQGAYNASATVFRTLDEMTATARDLK